MVVTVTLIFGPILGKPGDRAGPFDIRHRQTVVYRENQKNRSRANGQHAEQRHRRDRDRTYGKVAWIRCRGRW